MPATIPDANIDTSSSLESGSATQGTGAKVQQSPADKSNSKSTTGEKPPSFRDVAHEFMAKYKTDSDGSEKEKEKVTQPVVLDKTPKAQGENESGSFKEPNQLAEPKEKVVELPDKEQTPANEQPKTDDSKLPFHNHPRIKELVKQRNSFETQIREAQPLIDAGKRMSVVEKFCTENNILAQDYDNSLRIAALVNKDPKQAITVLKTLVQDLEVREGVSLPTDLQTRVDEGKLSIEDAQEISAGRVEKKRLTGQVEQTQQQSREQLQTQLTKSVNSWITSKMGTDPSFKPSNSNEYGKFEQVQDRVSSLSQQENPRTVEDLIKLMEKAYNQIHGFIEKATPKPVQRRLLSPKNSVREEEKVVDIRKPGWARQIGRELMASR